jgi:hypothetical protein
VTSCPENYCRLLQEIGFPAARIKGQGAEVIECNELFRSLLTDASCQDDARSFFRSVLPGTSSTGRDYSDPAINDQAPAQVRVQLQSADGQTSNFEMRTIAPVECVQSINSVICFFIPIAGPVFDRIRDEHLSEGEELVRLQIRNELHKGISQQLLGAAFGCKTLASKIGRVNVELGKEATELAELVNAAVTELQALVRSDRQ